MANTKPIELGASIRIRLSKEDKEAFDIICKRKAMNQSEWIRQKIREFINEQNGK